MAWLGDSVLQLPLARSSGVGLSVLGRPEPGLAVMRSGRLSRHAVLARDSLLARSPVLRGAVVRRWGRRRSRRVIRRYGRRLTTPAPLACARFARLVRFLRIAQDEAFPAAGLATA